MLVLRRSFIVMAYSAYPIIRSFFSRKTRTSTPIVAKEENENMSNGDESDDEDLTDSTSDSDWSDFAGESSHC